ncbi:hypothetical protein TNCV_1694921 [Trichonephila clavipes]|nr:hypothetical protein TNCV_1694921 [Trichonephila clavipes]
MDLVILNHGQVTESASELPLPSPNSTSYQRKDVRASTDLTCIVYLEGWSLAEMGSNYQPAGHESGPLGY